MKRIISLAFVITAAIFLIVIGSSCNDEIGIVESGVNKNLSQALMKVADNSPSINSFTPNYNEEGAMSFSGTLGKEIYPIRVGQKLKLVDRNFSIVKDSTTATGTLVQKFEGQLIIAGSFQKPTIGINSRVDTVIQKPISTTITRQIKFQRVANTGNDTTDWKIVGISLPVGGTTGNNIQIEKLTLTAQDGSTVEISNPNTFFFNVGKDKKDDNDSDDKDDNDSEDDDGKKFGFGAGLEMRGWFGLHTWYKRNQHVKLTVEILSSASDPDVLTITYGAMTNGNFRTKEKFELKSSVQDGAYYRKIYERNWLVPSHQGKMHAVINALPRAVVYDTDTSVEEKTWGIPYKVK